MILLYISILLPICTAFRVCSAPCPSRGGRFALSISRYEIYRLRRQKEILDAMNYILERRDKLRIGRNIDPIIIESIHIVEVELNSDCSHARLKVCIAGDSFQQRQGFSWLEKNSKMLRYRMAQILGHRKNVPTLSFHSHNLVQQAGEFQSY